MKTVFLPKQIVDTHLHGRGGEEAHKTTPKQVLKEARQGLISISCFEPNTKPALTSLAHLMLYYELIDIARKHFGLPPQYIWLGVTDNNLTFCDMALGELYVIIGLKVYPKSVYGESVTTGDTIGVSQEDIILGAMRLGAKHRKAVQFHCDDPATIISEGHTVRAEVEYIKKIIHLGRQVPGVKIIICHPSCQQSVELILAAQAEGMQIVIELMVHYLWFDNKGTNWAPGLHANFYKCFNSLRGPGNRVYLRSLLTLDNPLIWVASDSACHTKEEKLNGAAGIPSNQHLVPACITVGRQIGLPDYRLSEILSWRQARFLGIDVPIDMIEYEIEEREDDTIYNDGVVVNPWKGSKLFFPV